MIQWKLAKIKDIMKTYFRTYKDFMKTYQGYVFLALGETLLQKYMVWIHLLFSICMYLFSSVQ